MYKIILFLTCKAASTDAENDFTELLEHLASSSFISDKILFKRGHGAFAKIGELKSKFQLILNNFILKLVVNLHVIFVRVCFPWDIEFIIK